MRGSARPVGPTIVIEIGCESADEGSRSDTRRVNVNVPVAVGVPAIRPVPDPTLRPGGNEPDATTHVRGATPPA